MFYYRKKKEKKNSKPTNLFELYICIQQAIVCGWMMIIDVVNFLSNILIYVSPCIAVPANKSRDDKRHPVEQWIILNPHL